MDKACELLKERLTSIQDYSKLIQMEENDLKKKLLSSVVVKLKRQEKVRVLKENELLEALFTFKSASKNERLTFEKTSYELMVMLSPEFVYQVQDKGLYSEIADMYIAYYTYTNNANKVEEIRIINQNNIYHNFPFLCMLYKGLVEFSKKLFQEKVKSPCSTQTEDQQGWRRDISNPYNKRNEPSFVQQQLEQRFQKTKVVDKQNNIIVNENFNEMGDYSFKEIQNEQQKNDDLNRDILANQMLTSQQDIAKQYIIINGQKNQKNYNIASNSKRGSSVSNQQYQINVVRSETPENTRHSNGQISTNASQSSSSVQKKYFSSRLNSDGIYLQSNKEEIKSFLGQQRFYSSQDKEKFTLYQMSVLHPSTPQSNIQHNAPSVNFSFSFSTGMQNNNNLMINPAVYRNQYTPNNSNNISDTQQSIVNSHVQALSCPQFTRRNYFRIVKEAVDDAEFVVFKRNELLATYYYKNIIARNQNIAKTIENYRIQANLRKLEKSKQNSNIDLIKQQQQNANKNGIILPQLNNEIPQFTHTNQNKSKSTKLDFSPSYIQTKQNEQPLTTDIQQNSLLPSIVGKKNQRTQSDVSSKKANQINGQPAISSLQNVQNIYQNANQKLMQVLSSNKQQSSSKKNKITENKQNQKWNESDKQNSNSETNNEAAKLSNIYITREMLHSDIDEEKAYDSSKIHDTQDTDQSFQGQENQTCKDKKNEQNEQLNKSVLQDKPGNLQNQITFYFNEIKVEKKVIDSNILLNIDGQSTQQKKIYHSDINGTDDLMKENKSGLQEIQEEENTHREFFQESDTQNADTGKLNQKTYSTSPMDYTKKQFRTLQQSSTEEKQMVSRQKNIEFLERNLDFNCPQLENNDKQRMDTSTSEYKKKKRREQSKSQHEEQRQQQIGGQTISQQDMNKSIYEKIRICEDLINEEKSIDCQINREKVTPTSENSRLKTEEKRINTHSPISVCKKIPGSRLQLQEIYQQNNTIRNASIKPPLESIINKENIPLLPKVQTQKEESNESNIQKPSGIFDLQQQFQQYVIEGCGDGKVLQIKPRISGQQKMKDQINNLFYNRQSGNQTTSNYRQKQKYAEEIINFPNSIKSQKETQIQQLTNKLQDALTINKDQLKTQDAINNSNNEGQSNENFRLPFYKQGGVTNGKSYVNTQNKKVNLNTSLDTDRRKNYYNRNYLLRNIENETNPNTIRGDLSLDQNTPIVAPIVSSEYTSIKNKYKSLGKGKYTKDETINGFNYSKGQSQLNQRNEEHQSIASNYTTIIQQNVINPNSQNTSIEANIADINKSQLANLTNRNTKHISILKTPKISNNQNQSITNALIQLNKESEYTLGQISSKSTRTNPKVQSLKSKEFYNIISQGPISHQTSQSTKIPIDSSISSTQQGNNTDHRITIDTPSSNSSRHIQRRSLRVTQFGGGCGRSFLSTSSNQHDNSQLNNNTQYLIPKGYKIESEYISLQAPTINFSAQNTIQIGKSIQAHNNNGYSTSSNIVSIADQDDSQSFCDTQIREKNSIIINQTNTTNKNSNQMTNQSLSNHLSSIQTQVKQTENKQQQSNYNKFIQESSISELNKSQQNEVINLQKSQQNKLKSILQDYNLMEKDGKFVQQPSHKKVNSSIEGKIVSPKIKNKIKVQNQSCSQQKEQQLKQQINQDHDNNN